MKLKPDQVIVHRIEFQQHERELLELATASYSVNNVVTPFVTLFTDEGFLIFLTLMLESAGVTDWFPDGLNQAVLELGVDSWNLFWDAAREAGLPSHEGGAVPSWKIEASRIWAVATMALAGLKSKVD